MVTTIVAIMHEKYFFVAFRYELTVGPQLRYILGSCVRTISGYYIRSSLGIRTFCRYYTISKLIQVFR